MIDRDPPRLAETALDARVRDALEAARARTPSSLQLEALAGKVAGATHAASSAGFFAKLLGQASALKVSIAVIALGSALWLALRPEQVSVSVPRPAPPVAVERVSAATPELPRAMPLEDAAPRARSAIELEAEPRAALPVQAERAQTNPLAAKAQSKRSVAAPRARASARASASPSTRAERAEAEEQPREPEPPPREAPNPQSELELLGRVQGMLARDPDGALDLLEEHRQAFPRGAFSEEREALAIDALRRLGRRSELRARAEAFLARYPSSPHCDRIRRWLE